MTCRRIPAARLASALIVSLVGLAVSSLAAGCGDDSSTGTGGAGGGATGSGATTSGSTTGNATTGNATTGNATTGNGATTSTTSGAGGVGGEGAGGPGGAGAGTGGAGAGTGGAAGFPWEGALDPDAGPSSERLTAHEQGSTTAPRGFHEYLPPGYPGDVQWPLLVFVHGLGENGNGTSQLGDVLATGIPDLIENDAWPSDRPFVVLAPQHQDDGGCTSAAEIEDMIAYGIETYAIDPRYVYLTGLSCGAIGGWSYVEQNLDAQIAAFVPIAGNGSGAWNSQGCDLGKVAIWAFHGDADGTVDVSGTHTPMDGLATCPSPPALENRKTIYPDVGHNSWSQTYDLSAGHDIYTWMLGFTHQP